ncbi:MAG: hypothetical protein ABFD98_04735 [Syntrophobacteraceae bacterium]|nr:hypothetical protein [Desulfobacteraceae bacterium]
MATTTVSTMDRLAGLVIGLSLTTISILLIVLGLSFLPVIGVLAAIPVMGLARYFFKISGEKAAALEEGVVSIAYKRAEMPCR